MAGYISGAVQMMQLGTFQFGIPTAAYQELTRSTRYRWPNQERFGQADVLQYTGMEADSLRLQGVIYPEWRGGTGQVDAMRALAGGGAPLLLVSGTGAILGNWVIASIEERQSVFAGYGVPRRQEFTLELRKFGEVTPDQLAAIAAATDAASEIEAAAAGDLSTLDGIKATVTSMAQSVQSAAADAIGTLNSAMADVIADAAPFIEAGESAIGAVSRGLKTAQDLQRAAKTTVRQVQSVKSIFGAKSSAKTLLDTAAGLANRASSATDVLGNVLDTASGAGARVTRALTSARSASANVENIVRGTVAAAGSLYEKIG